MNPLDPDALAPRPDPVGRSALAQLVDDMVSRRAMDGEDALLDYFRNTWARLSAEQRLTQSLAQTPDHAGPLNSHHLVHRSLTLMREVSPGYLHRFMSYVDALLWVDQAGTPAPVARTPLKRRGG